MLLYKTYPGVFIRLLFKCVDKNNMPYYCGIRGKIQRPILSYHFDAENRLEEEFETSPDEHKYDVTNKSLGLIVLTTSSK